MSKTYNNKETAKRYDTARALPNETLDLWMRKLLELVPAKNIERVIDLGGGTGRFAAPLQKAYKCPVIVIDPSEEMLQEGRNRKLKNVTWICGSAEKINLDDRSVDLIWMSNVFHHLENRKLAFQEIYRILNREGYLVIRNGTYESDLQIEWLNYFPEAREFDKGRIPTQNDINSTVSEQGFNIVKLQTIWQLLASSYSNYYDKINQRGLSSLISISDEAFQAGLKRLQEFVARQPPTQPVYEPLDLFVFRKS